MKHSLLGFALASIITSSAAFAGATTEVFDASVFRPVVGTWEVRYQMCRGGVSDQIQCPLPYRTVSVSVADDGSNAVLTLGGTSLAPLTSGTTSDDTTTATSSFYSFTEGTEQMMTWSQGRKRLTPDTWQATHQVEFFISSMFEEGCFRLITRQYEEDNWGASDTAAFKLEQMMLLCPISSAR